MNYLPSTKLTERKNWTPDDSHAQLHVQSWHGFRSAWQARSQQGFLSERIFFWGGGVRPKIEKIWSISTEIFIFLKFFGF